jgi:demethylsterigmatocystin 6-O-methyltransferase
MGKHPENLETFMLWMGGHRLRDREWLDVFPFRDLVANGAAGHGDAAVFVDVGGGIGHQCKVYAMQRITSILLTILGRIE